MAEPMPNQPPQWPLKLVGDTEPTTQSVQAAVEGTVEQEAEGDYAEFLGEKFRLAEGVSMMPLLAYAAASKKGLDTEDMAGMAAVYRLIRSVIWRKPLYDEHGVRQVDEATGRPAFDETEWDRFETLADDEMVEGEELMEFVGQAMEVMSARPRKRREISSGGSPRTSPNSRASSSSPGTVPQAGGLTPVKDL